MFDLCCQNQGADTLRFFAENHPAQLSAPKENPFFGTMGTQPVANAAKKGNVEAFNFLLQYTSQDGESMAARLQDASQAPGRENYRYMMLGAFPSGELVQKALDAGVDPNEQAVLSGPAKFFCGAGRACLKAGIGTDSFMVNLFASLEGQRPLHQAAGSGNVGVVEVLLKAGADPRLRNAMGQTPLDIAEQKQQQRCADLIRAEIPKWPAAKPASFCCGQEELPEASPALLRKIRAEYEGQLQKRASKESIGSYTTADSDTASTCGSSVPAEMWL